MVQEGCPLRLITALLARNEAASDRYLKRVLTRCLEFSDTVVLLDDNSDDATPDIAREMGCVVEVRQNTELAWGREASARRELWELASRYATGPNDWVLIADADMEMVGDVRSLCKSRDTNTWSFVLFDLWSDTEYRADGPWVGHTSPRPWLFAVNRVPPNWTPQWNDRGLHVGHCPLNWPAVVGVAPPETYHWKHWSYAKPEHRIAKHQQYMSKKHLLSPSELAHAESILA